MKASRTHVLSALLLLLTSLSAAAQESRIPSKGYAVFSNEGNFQPYEFDRHPVGENDVLLEILYAGICHSDVHHVREDWRSETYPMVPGHEILGRVVQKGDKVTKFEVGDYAGVGCLVNSCGECDYCLKNEEQYCAKRVLTYASHDHYHDDELTQGGYSNNIVLSERFAIKVPDNAEMEKVAPLLCAGITTYSPIQQTGVKRGDKVAVAGFGGLGHMAVQYAVALGAEVTVFDITEGKRRDAIRMGATRYVNVNDPEQMKALNNTFRVIINTIPAPYDPSTYLQMLAMDGEMVIVGVPAVADTPKIDTSQFVWHARRKISGSQIGGIAETQEMLDYSVANGLYPEVEVIGVEDITESYKKVVHGKAKFRYVIDMRTLDK